MIQKNILILIGIISLSYILIFLLSSKDITDYTIADTEYWRQTNNRLLIKTAYDYNNKEDLAAFPSVLGDWTGYDYKYSENVYKTLNADILMSRTYVTNGSYIWVDFINGKTGENFHKQTICIKGAGWTIDSESVAEFKIADAPNPFTKLYANRIDASRENEKQIVIYWFMFKKFGGSNDSVSMVRLSKPFFKNDTTGAFKSIKDFIEGQLFGAMYKGTAKEEITNAESISREYGDKGTLAILIGILIPLGTAIIGVMKKD